MMRNITPLRDILTECEEIDKLLSITMSEDANEAVERGNTLITYIARTGKLLADAKYHLNEKMEGETIQLIKELVDKKYSAGVQNALIKSVAKEERYAVDWCERLNATCTHQVEWMRTVISKAKAEMQNKM